MANYKLNKSEIKQTMKLLSKTYDAINWDEFIGNEDKLISELNEKIAITMSYLTDKPFDVCLKTVEKLLEGEA